MGGTNSTSNENVIWHRDEIIMGYKGFDPHMRCQNMLYEIGKIYEIPQNDLSMC